MSDLQDALAAIKDLAKTFAPLATVGADIDRIMALVAHEDELKKSIETKLETLRAYDAEMADKLAATDADIEHRQQVQADAEAGYEKKLADLDARYRAARDRATDAETDANARVKDAGTAAASEIATLKADLATERARATAEHNAFIDETKSHRAKIEANTAIMEATLREMREQAHAALGAVEGHA